MDNLNISKDELKEVLRIQSEYLILIESYIGYLNETYSTSQEELLPRSYIQIITRLIKRDLVTSLNILCNGNENYSFSKLLNKEESLLKNEGIKKEHRIYLKKRLDEINVFFVELNIKEIRDTYCAHLDKSRKSISFKIEDISSLHKSLYHFHSEISNFLFEESIILGINRSALSEIIIDNKRLKSFINSERKSKH